MCLFFCVHVIMWFGLVLLRLNFPVTKIFSHVGTEPPLPAYYQYFSGSNYVFAQGHNTAEVGIETPTSRSGVRGFTTRPPGSPVIMCVYDDN